jgi:GcrA cell cycle regulator
VHGNLPNAPVSLDKADAIRVERAKTGASAIKAFAEPANDDAIPLLARRYDQCAWPVGNPERPEGQLVCGAEVKPERPYCAHHCGIGFVPWTKKTSPNELARSLRRFC